MAKFIAEYPKEIIDDFRQIYNDYGRIVGAMTRAGAEVVYKNVQNNAPKGIKNSEMMKCLRLTRTYKTPSDDGTNTKVGFYGYFTNKNGVKTPAPLVANVYEYGRSNAPFPKEPFFRRAFNTKQIEKAMLEAQKRESGGLLE